MEEYSSFKGCLPPNVMQIKLSAVELRSEHIARLIRDLTKAHKHFADDKQSPPALSEGLIYYTLAVSNIHRILTMGNKESPPSEHVRFLGEERIILNKALDKITNEKYEPEMYTDEKGYYSTEELTDLNHPVKKDILKYYSKYLSAIYDGVLNDELTKHIKYSFFDIQHVPIKI